jgi:hypothetical protein
MTDDRVEKITATLAQKMERRFYGKYRGFVKKNQDPENLGRLMVTVPSVLGDKVALWAFPCVPYGGMPNQGFLFIPENNAGVWIEFEEGDPEFPIWVGTFWSKPNGKSEVTKPNGPDGTEKGDVQSPPSSKIIKTQKGHTLQMEDKDGDEMILLVEGKNKHVVTLNKDGIKITDGLNKNEIILEQNGITISAKDNNNQIIMESSGITLKKDSHEIKIEGSGVTINSTAIKIGSSSSTEPLVLGNELKTAVAQLVAALNSHQHTGNLGNPTPIINPIQWDITSALSQNNTTE